MPKSELLTMYQELCLILQSFMATSIFLPCPLPPPRARSCFVLAPQADQPETEPTAAQSAFFVCFRRALPGGDLQSFYRHPVARGRAPWPGVLRSASGANYPPPHFEFTRHYGNFGLFQALEERKSEFNGRFGVRSRDATNNTSNITTRPTIRQLASHLARATLILQA